MMPYMPPPASFPHTGPGGESPHNFQEEQDDLLIQKALDFDPTNSYDFNSRELEPGEKAEDAIDYGDLSDEYLSDDEDGPKPQFPRRADRLDATRNGLEDSLRDDDVDDPLYYLFHGVHSPSSPAADANGPKFSQPSKEAIRADGNAELEGEGQTQDNDRYSLARSEIGFRNRPKRRPGTLEQQQQALFSMSRYIRPDPSPLSPKNKEESLKSLWPKYERGIILKLMDLLPPKTTSYIGAMPRRPPKPLRPTTFTLDLADDQKQSFRLPCANNPKIREDAYRAGVIVIANSTTSHKAIAVTDDTNGESDFGINADESSFENSPVGGASWQDIQLACADWETYSDARSPTPEQMDIDQDDLYPVFNPAAKARIVTDFPTNILRTPQFRLPLFNDPERDTSELAKSVVLDLNKDSGLLVDSNGPEPTAARNRFREPARENGDRRAFATNLIQRYNVSNDHAYDQLKINQHEKVRSTVGNLEVEHSTPAIRLQYPYYRARLGIVEARAFHRPSMKFMHDARVTFSTPGVVKRKHRKGKGPRSIFESTKHLSLGDNSEVLLLEYSEEYPIMLSNFGMGSRLINYYRRKDTKDTSHPRLEIGETQILLSQDKSPFYLFGDVEPGQITSAFTNSMYNAPVYKHDASSTDFLVIRNTSGLEGSRWYIRSIGNLRIVGQEFPSREVPRPGSHLAHGAVRKRLKMISYRQIRRSKETSTAEIMKHFTDLECISARQKLKDFLRYCKDSKRWQMPHGEDVPDEETIGSLIKPEDVCVLDSMQAGHQHLQDIGLSKEYDDSEVDEGKDGEIAEQQLAPWKISKTFISAAQGRGMVHLHGEGDPSGRGEAFSFIKTNSREGFRAVGESVEDKLNEQKMKAAGGRGHHIAQHEKAYRESIRRIWEAQTQSLSSKYEQCDSESDAETISGDAAITRPKSPSSTATRRLDDDSASLFSRFSIQGRSGKMLKITRHVRNDSGNIEEIGEIVTDPRVIRLYLKRRFDKETEETNLLELKPTGDKALDQHNVKRLEKELARLEKNKERRLDREKKKKQQQQQKGMQAQGTAEAPAQYVSPLTFTSGASPSGVNNAASAFNPVVTPTPAQPTVRQHKCTKCGQTGHIRTNKRLCAASLNDDKISKSTFPMGDPSAI